MVHVQLMVLGSPSCGTRNLNWSETAPRITIASIVCMPVLIIIHIHTASQYSASFLLILMSRSVNMPSASNVPSWKANLRVNLFSTGVTSSSELSSVGGQRWSRQRGSMNSEETHTQWCKQTLAKWHREVRQQRAWTERRDSKQRWQTFSCLDLVSAVGKFVAFQFLHKLKKNSTNTV